MKRGHFLLAAVLLMAGSAAFADEPEATAENNQDAKQEKKICKTEKLTGSLTRVRRTCLTQAEWDRVSEAARRNVSDLERDANRGVAREWAHGESGTDETPFP